MSMPLLVYVLTVVGGAVVVLTRAQLGRPTARSVRSSGASGMLTIYGTSGLVGLAAWSVFLIFPEDSMLGHSLVGVIGLFFWWIATLTGLRTASLPVPPGKHAAPGRRGSRRKVLLASQLVLLAAVGFCTWAYTTAAV
ncbi:MAG: hypothetical protein ACRCYU_19150 [Nocardioides sp.]